MKRELLEKRDEILRIARRHGVGRVRVFGSVARDEASDTSDIDLLIDVTGPTTPWFPGGLVAELEELLDCRVDVVESESVNKELRAAVLKEAVPL
jgi:predicted nucleotidyltransferase